MTEKKKELNAKQLYAGMTEKKSVLSVAKFKVIVSHFKIKIKKKITAQSRLTKEALPFAWIIFA